MTQPAMYGALAPFYDRIYQRKDYRAEARRILGLARRKLGRDPQSLLDVACGTGRHLSEYPPGMALAGVDASPSMLRIARQRLPRRVPLTRGDMRSFQLDRRFDVLTCLFSAIGHLPTRSDRDRALTNFFRHLLPGGVAIVEGWILPSRWRDQSIHLVSYADQKVALARVASAHREGSRSVVEYHYLLAERGRQIRHLREVDRSALVEPSEMLASFRRAGFRARMLRGPFYRDRGLFVGVRPRGPPDARPGRRRLAR